MDSPIKPEKPIDRWLGIGGIAVALALFLIPKTPRVVIGSLVLMFGLLIHPLWHFWWIEAKLWRKIAATLLLAIGLLYLGQIAWPPESLSSQPHFITTFAKWWSGHHGRWFDRAIGAIYALAIIFFVLLVAALGKVLATSKVSGRPKGFLDYKLQAESSIVALPSILENFSALTNGATQVANKLVNDFGMAGGSTAKALTASRSAAMRLGGYSARTLRVKTKLEREAHFLSEGLCGWSAWIQQQQAPREQFSEFADGLRGVKESTDEAIESMRIAISSTISAKGAFSVLDAALDRQIEVRVAVLRCCEELSRGFGAALAVFDALPTQ